MFSSPTGAYLISMVHPIFNALILMEVFVPYRGISNLNDVCSYRTFMGMQFSSPTGAYLISILVSDTL